MRSGIDGWEEQGAEIAPGEEGGTSIGHHTHDGDSKAAIEGEDGNMIEEVGAQTFDKRRCSAQLGKKGLLGLECSGLVVNVRYGRS